MSEALRNKQIDMAIMLTEGAIAAISGGDEFSIRLPFVISPLIWGVFVNAKRPDKDLPDLHSARFAVSRMKSGSQLMAKFYAQREAGVVVNDDQFIVCQNIDGARNALAHFTADYFLWEKYMTAIWVENGEFRQISEVTAPWPAFLFVTRKNEFSDFGPIKESLKETVVNFYDGNIMDWKMILSDEFNLSAANAEHWLKRIKYYDGNTYWPDRIAAATMIMKGHGMIDHAAPALNTLIVT
jgi:hypothetical protein